MRAIVNSMLRNTEYVRNMHAGDLLETFLVSAISSLLAVRVYLTLTGFPQLGGSGLHIAHMLWGGLIMMIAIVLLLAFLGNRILWAGAIIGGIGFGIFIDELGKVFRLGNSSPIYQRKRLTPRLISHGQHLLRFGNGKERTDVCIPGGFENRGTLGFDFQMEEPVAMQQQQPTLRYRRVADYVVVVNVPALRIGILRPGTPIHLILEQTPHR